MLYAANDCVLTPLRKVLNAGFEENEHLKLSIGCLACFFNFNFKHADFGINEYIVIHSGRRVPRNSYKSNFRSSFNKFGGYGENVI